MSRKVVMLYSGGADSYAMLRLARDVVKVDSIHCILIDYGQKHIKELDVAEKHLKDLVVPYDKVKVDFNNKIISALTGIEQSVCRDHVSEWHVPSRNMMFTSIAASFAETLHYNEIWYGADYSDFIHEFPDCYQTWVGKMNDLLEVNGYRGLYLHAPLLGITKEDALSICYHFNKDLEVYSGYDGVRKCSDLVDPCNKVWPLKHEYIKEPDPLCGNDYINGSSNCEDYEEPIPPCGADPYRNINIKYDCPTKDNKVLHENALYIACKADNFKVREELHEKLKDLCLRDPVFDYKVTKTDGVVLPNTIVDYDKNVLLQCSSLVAFLEEYSAGTCMEILYAAEHKIPVYVIDPTLKFRDDIWICTHAVTFFDSVSEFVDFYSNKIKGEEK